MSYRINLILSDDAPFALSILMTLDGSMNDHSSSMIEHDIVSNILASRRTGCKTVCQMSAMNRYKDSGSQGHN